MKKIAITGGIAAGKSTVCEMFQGLGALILDADTLAHHVYDPGTPLHQDLVDRFGPEILLENGNIDRSRLGEIVFQSEKDKKWLESQTHPATRDKIVQKINEAADQSYPLVLIEAALHVETGYYREFEGLIVVHVSPQVQIERVMARDSISQKEAEQRLANQMPVDEKKKYGDWVIDNSGDREKTQSQVADLFRELMK